MTRELLVLGTSSMAPTRQRNHNGYLLYWDDLGILFDPGEGIQRQMLLAGARSSQITHIAVTHRHGDHTLGLPGILQRMALDQRRDPVFLVYPEEAGEYLDGLLGLEVFDSPTDVRRVPLPDDRRSTIDLNGGRELIAEPLDHRVPALGYRLTEPDDRQMDSDRLAQAGLDGPIVGQLVREGQVTVDGRTITVEEVSDPRRGQAFAFVMDTRRCDAVERLTAGCDLAVVESTYQDGDEALAERYGHMTATQAGAAASAAGVRRLVVAHFSQRYEDPESFGVQARVQHDDVVAAVDFDTVAVPSRTS